MGRVRARIVTPRNKPQFIHFYEPSDSEDYKRMVAKCAMVAMRGRGLLRGSLIITITAHMPIMPSWNQKKKESAYDGSMLPTTKPDWDNFGKIASDALNGVVYEDDSQIVEGTVRKRYSGQPRLEIEIQAA